MIKLNVKKIAQILKAKLIGEETLTIESVSTDTRRKMPNGLFFALKGEKFDGHNYLAEAVAQGCTAVVVDHPCEIDVPQLVVKDTRLALGRLAAWLRRELEPLTVAITGSCGKTTVKEMTAAILQRTAGDDEAVLFTEGNFNNDIGVPLTLLRLTEKHEYAVIELGANHAGEIAYTAHLTMPDVALVNNVSAAHLEGFGSVEGVAQAKGEIYSGLTPDGVAILNLDSNYAHYWGGDINDREFESFAYDHVGADYYAEKIMLSEYGSRFTLNTPKGAIKIELPYLGKHNVANAVAASALAMNVGASLEDIKRGLENPSHVKGRLFPIQLSTNLLLLDDTYNANVASVKSAISVLSDYREAFRIFAFGDMAELGDETISCHQEVADFAKAANLDLVVTYGSESAVVSKACGGVHFSNKEALIASLKEIISHQLKENEDIVLLAKGSRSMKMEDVINSLKDRFLC
ncbi:UDP-N-acetylmuramoyl-tripeptide--D-alanyl-D-alanine ligase [Basfia succiniciproducens]|uniref:UDP-N-acetylmuramoyl-tripeptide--D-alanyl-D-alanine ligase n=1 Tax=Mannheimia succiniciproducens (strain KCTC 0769BP / MBEL55E) TaxID=221988 RepID=Q65RY2_MANSM|nr:UDP-N-acetylmuramoyl-tripeptide--D-alanyl-D-alanine ligase [[Mannheimia] succiniciproducens]AAU38278.1 MurF protein [[Mannheimia] succiniciproducens MBEL55E]